eukprot:evm.model.scf_29.6 EVM.evm.TU.scf_29.6   scf_29:107107-108819(+)
MLHRAVSLLLRARPPLPPALLGPHLPSRLHSSSPSPLRFCVVGAGPAGFYAADRLLRRHGDRATVDILDRLPTPFGLVASGVAPDHADTKNVTRKFARLAEDPRVTFFGNVAVGRDDVVSVGELRALYHGVVIAHGAEGERRLGVAGEDLPGVFSARDFVWWYNGHPDAANLDVDLSSVRDVVIVGLGNVALDCARILLKHPNELAATDVAGHALAQLKMSSVCSVRIVGRRGPAQAGFTPKELREVLGLPGVRRFVRDRDLRLGEGDEVEIKKSRPRARVHAILQKAAKESLLNEGRETSGDGQATHEEKAARDPLSNEGDNSKDGKAPSEQKAAIGPASKEGRDKSGAGHAPPEQKTAGEGGMGAPSMTGGKSLHLHFLRSPVEMIAGPGGAQVGSMKVEVNELTRTSDGGPAGVVGTGVYEELPAQMVLKTIGYRTLPLPGVPFDERRAVVPHRAGRVVGRDGDPVPGLYVCGWAKRGPSGVIGTNLIDAEETAGSVWEDAAKMEAQGEAPGGGEGLRRLLTGRGVQVVGWEGWRTLEAAEIEGGRILGKAREKVTSVEEMLRLALQ